MKLVPFKALLVLTFASLTACSTGMWNRGDEVVVTRNVGYSKVHRPRVSSTLANEQSVQNRVGQNIQMVMDENDKNKLSRALDGSPGKPTQWVNDATGVTYTVVPIKKVIVSGNPFCREYNVTAVKNSRTKQSHGTACVGSDGTWKVVNV